MPWVYKPTAHITVSGGGGPGKVRIDSVKGGVGVQVSF